MTMIKNNIYNSETDINYSICKQAFMWVMLTCLCFQFAQAAQQLHVEAQNLAQLRKVDDYCLQGAESISIGWGHPGYNTLYTAVTRFDLSNYTGSTAVTDGVMKFYARIAQGHSEDLYGFRLIELNKSFEFYPENGWQSNGLNWNYRNPDLDRWAEGDLAGDGYYFNKGAIWDTTFGDIGTFMVPEGTNEYTLITVSVPKTVIQRWLNGANNGIVVAPNELITWRSYHRLELAGPGSGFALPVLEFEIKNPRVSVPVEHMVLLRANDDYALQDGQDMDVGYNHPGYNTIYSIVTRFDLNAYQGLQSAGDGLISLYAKKRPGHNEDRDGFQLIELDKNFEFYESRGWHLNSGLNWNFRNSAKDPWTGNFDFTWNAYHKGAVWDTTYGTIGTFAVANQEYELKKIVVPKEKIQRWLNGENHGIVIASGNLIKYATYSVIHIAGINSEIGPPTLEFNVLTEFDGAKCGDKNHQFPNGDINNDCLVNISDLEILVKNWLNSTAP